MRAGERWEADLVVVLPASGKDTRIVEVETLEEMSWKEVVAGE